MSDFFGHYDERPSVIILGLGTNGLAVARALGRKRVPLLILEEKKNSNQAHLKTKYGEKKILTALTGQPVVDFVNNLQEDSVLFPTTDQQVLWISENRHLLPEKVKIIFPSHQVVQQLLDKDLFFAYCQKNKFPLSPYIIAQSGDDIVKITQTLRLPLIIKTPQKAYKKGLAKAYIVNSSKKLQETWATISQLHNKFIVQEFVKGTDSDVYFCLQYIGQNGDLLASFTGRKIRQWKPLCGGTSSCEPVEVMELRDKTFEVLRKAGFYGIGSVEYKLDKREGKYYIIEPTVCRTDFQEQLAIVNGVNIPYIAYCDVCGLPVEPCLNHSGHKAWMHVMHDRLAADYYIKNKEITRWQWLQSLAKVRSFDLFSARDPLPAFVSILRRFQR